METYNVSLWFYIYIYTHTSIYMYIYVHINMCVYTCTYIYVYIYIYIYMSIHIHIYTFVRVCIYIHIYNSTHAATSRREGRLYVTVSIVMGFECGHSCPRLYRDGSYDRGAHQCGHNHRAPREIWIKCVWIELTHTCCNLFRICRYEWVVSHVQMNLVTHMSYIWMSLSLSYMHTCTHAHTHTRTHTNSFTNSTNNNANIC